MKESEESYAGPDENYRLLLLRGRLPKGYFVSIKVRLLLPNLSERPW
jgi:hypothetical protein